MSSSYSSNYIPRKSICTQCKKICAQCKSDYTGRRFQRTRDAGKRAYSANSLREGQRCDRPHLAQWGRRAVQV